MKAFGVKEYKPDGDLSALKEVTMEKPRASGKDLLVEVKAVATNPIDYKKLSNLGNHEAEYELGETPLVVGWDASGIIVEVGEETSLFKVGDEVMFAGDIFRPGAFAEFVLVDERIAGPKPKNLSWSQAASIPLTTLTAWEAMMDQLNIPLNKDANAGKVILIPGGAGGVATAAIEIAKKVLGLTIIGTGSREETVKHVKDLGADYVINHRKPLTAQIKEFGIEEIDYVFHTSDLTPELFTEFIGLLKPFGGICSIWPAAKVDLMQMFWKSIKFSAEMMFSRPAMKTDEKKRQHDILVQVSKLLEEGLLLPHETKTYPLSAANLRKALEFQASGKAIGKTTLFFEKC